MGKGEVFSPRDQYYYANELRDHGQDAQACEYYERFLAGGAGWVEDNLQACLKLAECRERQGDKQGTAEALCRTLQYDTPRAEFCCWFGGYLLEQGALPQAVYWYELALQLPPQTASMGIVNEAYATWLRHLQLALCYDRLGQHPRANRHNETALQLNPGHPSMLYNRNYFRNLLGAEYEELGS
ncbi:hypothetical protein [Paenibacillus donghaensis]|uniref:Tetratricopeptide repeat protein n=1 Tax=Paenibacillus donghaensis TaxID=414771 RepID=A0A2Z2KCS0_9BACL|nr:hypothetical protein [Paenibacillus donghaensis]ASA20800.1 hypothetical protein B9T62_08385 [Paenibacillus donghaensis]